MHDESVMPEGLEEVIKSLCADYTRRALVIECRSAPFNVIMEYRFLNYRMINAAIEVAGPRDARRFIKDIGESIGYSESELYLLSESVYKQRKAEVKNNIARRLSLL